MARDFSEDGAYGAGIAGVAGAQPRGWGNTQMMPDPVDDTSGGGDPQDSVARNTNLGGVGLSGAAAAPSAGGASGRGSGSRPGVGADLNTPYFTADSTPGASSFGEGWGGGSFTPTRDMTPFMDGGSDGSTGGAALGSSFPERGLTGYRFARGGAIDDAEMDPNATDPKGSMMGAQLQAKINAALGVVQNVLSYTHQKYGLGGGQKQAMNTDGFRQSDNVEDRTGEPGDPADAGAPGAKPRYSRNKTEQLVDRGREFTAGFDKLSQDAGINDIGSSGSGSQTAEAPAQQAISTDDEEPE